MIAKLFRLNSVCRAQLLPVMLCLLAVCASAQNNAQQRTEQRQGCRQNYYNGDSDRAFFNETREFTLPATALNVDALRNGGIQVTGSNRSDVLILACIQTQAETDAEAKSLAGQIDIVTNGVVRAEGPELTSGTSDTKDYKNKSHWSVSYEIFVPRNTDLQLQTYNGGIRIDSVIGTMNFEARNGGISLRDVGGDVRGKTQNGGLSIALSGSGWTGTGLDVETKNGGVSLSLPSAYAARLETGTVNGGFITDFENINVETKLGSRRKSVNTDLNGGGAPIRAITTNGGVRINRAE